MADAQERRRQDLLAIPESQWGQILATPTGTPPEPAAPPTVPDLRLRIPGEPQTAPADPRASESTFSSLLQAPQRAGELIGEEPDKGVVKLGTEPYASGEPLTLGEAVRSALMVASAIGIAKTVGPGQSAGPPKRPAAGAPTPAAEPAAAAPKAAPAV